MSSNQDTTKRIQWLEYRLDKAFERINREMSETERRLTVLERELWYAIHAIENRLADLERSRNY